MFTSLDLTRQNQAMNSRSAVATIRGCGPELTGPSNVRLHLSMYELYTVLQTDDVGPAFVKPCLIVSVNLDVYKLTRE